MAQSHAPPVALRITYITYPTAIRSMGGVKLNIWLHIIYTLLVFFHKFGCKDTIFFWYIQEKNEILKEKTK